MTSSIGSDVGSSIVKSIFDNMSPQDVQALKEQIEWLHNEGPDARQPGITYTDDAGLDPPAMTNPDAFATMPHQEIYHTVQGISATIAAQASMGWAKIGLQLDDSFAQLVSDIGKIIPDKWSGKAADAVLGGITYYARQSDQLTDAIRTVASKLETLSNGLDDVKSKVPPVPSGGKVTDFLHHHALGWVADMAGLKTSEHLKEEAEEQARQVMLTSYVGPNGALTQADNAVPQLPAPPQPVQRHDPGPGLDDGSHTAGGGAGGGANAATNPGGGEVAPQADAQPQSNQSAPPAAGASSSNHPGAGGNSGSQHGAGNPGASGDDRAGSTTAASALPGADVGAGLGADGGMGLTGDGPLGGGDGGLAEQRLGGGARGGVAAYGPAAATAGRPGMPGMGAPGGLGGKNKDEDKEHKSADYLRGTHHLEEWFEADRPPASPGVLGVWDEHGRPAT